MAATENQAVTGGTPAGPASPSEFEQLRRELSGKPGVWTILGLFFAAMALPFGLLAVWIPREFDALQQVAVEARNSAITAASASMAAETASASALDTIGNLAVAVARQDSWQKWLLVKSPMAAEGANGLAEILPADLFNSLQASGKLASFRYSDFMEERWIFVRSGAFNKLTVDEQEAFQQSIDRFDVRFFLEE
jgi:hypothetical protein